jgi:hypothetical protein
VVADVGTPESEVLEGGVPEQGVREGDGRRTVPSDAPPEESGAEPLVAAAESEAGAGESEAVTKIEEGKPRGSLEGVRRGASGETAISGPGGPYRIMVSSHKHEAAARLEAGELAGIGIDVEVVAAEVPDRGTWYRLLVTGGYPTLARARTVLDTIKTFGYEGAWIERTP